MIASATTEQSNSGTITQPPAFKTSNTKDPPAKNSAHFITKGLLTVTECRRFWDFRDTPRAQVFGLQHNRQFNCRSMVPISPAPITLAIHNQAIPTKPDFDGTDVRRIEQWDTQLLKARHHLLGGVAKTIAIACRYQGQLRPNSTQEDFRRTVPTAMMRQYQHIRPQQIAIMSHQKPLYAGINISGQQ